MKNVAIEAARRAGEVVVKYFDTATLERKQKNDKSFVTEADEQAERVIIETIKKSFPTHGFLGEEGGGENTEAEFVWVIDPIDGTGNFVNGIPIFCTSIALLHHNEPYIGVIYNPITQSLYVGERGMGVTYNNKRVFVSGQSAVEGSVTFGYGKPGKQRAFELAGSGYKSFRTTRILGSAALDLAYVARGGTEATVGLNLSKWDYAAGILLVKEAGGSITTPEGTPWVFGEGSYIASNGVAHAELLHFIKNT